MSTINLDYQPNAAYYGDCEEIIQAWKEQGVQGIIDLIYLDPPFNSNRNYGHPTAKAKKSETGSMDAFKEWTYDEDAILRVQNICNRHHPAREQSIEGLSLQTRLRHAGLPDLHGRPPLTFSWLAQRNRHHLPALRSICELLPPLADGCRLRVEEF